MNPRVLLLAPLLVMAGCATAPAPTDSGPTDSGPVAPVDVSDVPDATVRHEPRSRYGNPPYYEVFDQRYFVMDSSKDFVQEGVASWYGTKFHGKRTSSGEPYDMYAMTAAHKTLPLPTYVRVTNLENQRQVVVKVNDRGPFVGERIIDLSYTAATRLEMTQAGTARVRIEALAPDAPELDGQAPSPALDAALEEPPATVAAGDAVLFVQVGAFGDQANAQRLEQRLKDHGFATVIRSSGDPDNPVFRVRVGPLPDEAGFDQAMNRLRELDFPDAHLAVE